MDNITQINVELFKQAFYEIDKAEKRKSQLHKSTKIHHDIDVKIKNIENKLDDNLKFIFNNGLHNILFIIREELNEQNIKLRDEFKKELNEQNIKLREEFATISRHLINYTRTIN